MQASCCRQYTVLPSNRAVSGASSLLCSQAQLRTSLPSLSIPLRISLPLSFCSPRPVANSTATTSTAIQVTLVRQEKKQTMQQEELNAEHRAQMDSTTYVFRALDFVKDRQAICDICADVCKWRSKVHSFMLPGGAICTCAATGYLSIVFGTGLQL